MKCRDKRIHEYEQTDWAVKDGKESRFPISLCGIAGRVVDLKNWIHLLASDGRELPREEESMARAKIDCKKCIKIRKENDYDRKCDCNAKHQNHANPSYSFENRRV